MASCSTCSREPSGVMTVVEELMVRLVLATFVLLISIKYLEDRGKDEIIRLAYSEWVTISSTFCSWCN